MDKWMRIAVLILVLSAASYFLVRTIQGVTQITDNEQCQGIYC